MPRRATRHDRNGLRLPRLGSLWRATKSRVFGTFWDLWRDQWGAWLILAGLWVLMLLWVLHLSERIEMLSRQIEMRNTIREEAPK